MNKKTIIILCGCLIGLFIIAIIPKDIVDLSCAVVNPNNGDIAISYLDTSGGVSAIRVIAFNKRGRELFTEAYYKTGGHAALAFKEDILGVYVGKG